METTIAEQVVTQQAEDKTQTDDHTCVAPCSDPVEVPAAPLQTPEQQAISQKIKEMTTESYVDSRKGEAYTMEGLAEDMVARYGYNIFEKLNVEAPKLIAEVEEKALELVSKNKLPISALPNKIREITDGYLSAGLIRLNQVEEDCRKAEAALDQIALEEFGAARWQYFRDAAEAHYSIALDVPKSALRSLPPEKYAEYMRHYNDYRGREIAVGHNQQLIADIEKKKKADQMLADLENFSKFAKDKF